MCKVCKAAMYHKNKNQKLESDVLKSYLKKAPFFAHAVNSTSF
jgi:hypothetical protein